MNVSAAKRAAASAAATITEAFVVSTLEDAELSKPAKRRKLDHQIKKMEEWSKVVGEDIKEKVLQKILQEGASFMLRDGD